MKKKALSLFVLATSLFASLVLTSCLSNKPSGGDDPEVVDTDVKVTGVSLNFDTLEVNVGKKKTLVATVLPYNATDKEVTWTSSNSDVASVNNGVVEGLATGEATITVTTSDGGHTASCAVSVSVEEEEDPYVPDPTDTSIYFITEDTLSTGEYDETKDEYTFTVKNATYKQIYVNAPDKIIILELNNVTVENSENSPIYVETCDTLELSAKKSSTNYVKDTRAIMTEEEDTQGKGALYVKDGDLKLKGTGILNIEAGYYNGIHGKDDVKIQKQTLNVTAVRHGIKGNDSVTIDSGTISISCGGDGIKTENSDISSKLKQRGDITINGGTITVNSWMDAVSAAHDVIVDEAVADTPTVLSLNTNTKSSYDGEVAEPSTEDLYLKMNSTTYANGAYTYAAYIDNEWYPAAFKKAKAEEGGWGGRPGPGGPGGGGGGSTTYYYYELERPKNATSFVLYRFSGANVTEFSTTSYNAKSSSKAFNSNYDTITITASGSTLSLGSWGTYSNGVSAKGLKANNEVYVKNGTSTINANDDGIHANMGATLENGYAPLGNVNILGGTTTISSSDDGIHADNELIISGGSVDVLTSYEGIEGVKISMSGGSVKVFSTDDGVNASTGTTASSITISGGYLDVTVSPSGDTDGIDSNGTYTQTGGVVIARGPNSQMSAALDTDGTATISGGTIIVLGALGENGLTRGSGVSSYSLSLHSSGNKTVTIGGESLTFNNKYNYSKTICYSSVSVTA